MVLDVIQAPRSRGQPTFKRRPRAGFDTGTIVGVCQNRLQIILDSSGYQRMTSPLPPRYPHRFQKGDRVTVSWLWPMNRPPAGIPTLLDPYAVEPTDLWHRTSQHVSRFPDSLSEPTRLLEYEYVGVLRHHGIRAEHATIYEDENLGIDIWVFFYIEMAARWEWLPIDLTMCALPYREQKFREARSKGVIPLLMNQSHVKNRSHKLIPVMVRGIQLHFEQFPHVELFSRFAALLRNNAAPAYRTSTSRS